MKDETYESDKSKFRRNANLNLNQWSCDTLSANFVWVESRQAYFTTLLRQGWGDNGCGQKKKKSCPKALD